MAYATRTLNVNTEIYNPEYSTKVSGPCIMIYQRPLTFSELTKSSSYDLFYVVTSEALQYMEWTKKNKINVFPSIFMKFLTGYRWLIVIHHGWSKFHI